MLREYGRNLEGRKEERKVNQVQKVEVKEQVSPVMRPSVDNTYTLLLSVYLTSNTPSSLQ
ncbi:hypothetical protein E2C01_073731 [Portunus trituberculatus]|uniref:Uncharacterized protein n=1 Tax=Portunus trituberculatus TaxID=210409 RepID=A0A5B7IAI0_PORTR|nr:hypothetical protein [Portunus trituberculatus]